MRCSKTHDPFLSVWNTTNQQPNKQMRKSRARYVCSPLSRKNRLERRTKTNPLAYYLTTVASASADHRGTTVRWSRGSAARFLQEQRHTQPRLTMNEMAPPGRSTRNASRNTLLTSRHLQEYERGVIYFWPGQKNQGFVLLCGTKNCKKNK